MKADSLFLYEYDVKNNTKTKVPVFRCILPFKKNNLEWYYKHKDIVELCLWVDINIIQCMPVLTYITKDVMVRISTGMLNKCNIDRETNIIIHDILVENINKAYEEQIFKDLPF